jgi:K+-transporting ATPase KdpF subunit
VSADTLAGSVVTVLVLAYLLYTLLRPERF